MTTPSVEALDMAAEWLEQYDHYDDEPRLCHEVAKWLREKAEAKAQREAETKAIRAKAKELGVSPSRIRTALKNVRGKNAA